MVKVIEVPKEGKTRCYETRMRSILDNYDFNYIWQVLGDPDSNSGVVINHHTDTVVVFVPVRGDLCGLLDD